MLTILLQYKEENCYQLVCLWSIIPVVSTHENTFFGLFIVVIKHGGWFPSEEGVRADPVDKVRSKHAT